MTDYRLHPITWKNVKLNKKICYEIQLLKTQKKSINIKWQSHDQKILFYV
jgi:hypothetical protein